MGLDRQMERLGLREALDRGLPVPPVPPSSPSNLPTSIPPSSPGPFSEAEEDWLGAVLQALPSPTSSHGFDNRLLSIRRGVWGVSSLEDVEGGIGDASHIGVS